jgi:predicted RNA-binding Zn-ribbon protein involved in translation (DUF1610 family)
MSDSQEQSDARSTERECRNCGHHLRETRRAPTTRGRDGLVVQYRCDGCGQGGERYTESGLQFGPVFKPESYGTQLRAATSGRTNDHGIDTDYAKPWAVVADD